MTVKENVKMEKNTLKEFHENGNVKFERCDTHECSFDENGAIIHYKNSAGYEWWKEYDRLPIG